ncbi:MAG: EAL domain-containing protein [Clostridia bacterium]|nr:EAL domain-containing protein [Clostridia bacterium]
MTNFDFNDIIQLIKKYFVRVLALSLAIALISMLFASYVQTYSATLYFKFNHSQAAEGLAPDGTSKLDPYEIKTPVVIQGAIDALQLDKEKAVSIEGIRQNISITEVITSLDKEVSESAALLGEKYDVVATEYKMQYNYSSSLGEEFGAKMFASIVKEYDEFLMDKYYNRKTIVDFTKSLKDTTADYIDIANVMSTNLESIIEYMDEMASAHPDYRSKRTGHSFEDISNMYRNLRDIQYAKYYGNVRAGNLAKDRETVIKSYQAKVKELNEQWEVNNGIAVSYETEIGQFYESYKKSGLYSQANRMQSNLNNTNNRDEDVLDDSLTRDFINTYDETVLNYSKYATDAASNKNTINYYNTIINSFANDAVPQATKDRLIATNVEVLEEISALSAKYSVIANETVDEFLDSKVNNDLQYLISPEVTAEKPIKLIGIFVFILSFGLMFLALMIYKISSRYVKTAEVEVEEVEEKKIIDTNGLTELETAVYEQYLNDFNEFYLVYQPIVECKSGNVTQYEAFIRWKSPTFGNVSPGNIIENISKLGLFRQLNEWILKNVCKNIKLRIEHGEDAPTIHVNCPHSEVSGFALNNILIKYVNEYEIPASCICMELDGKNITNSLEDITLLNEMGIKICIDRFENSAEENEIIQVISPDYIKMSLDALNFDAYVTSGEDMVVAAMDAVKYFSNIISKCEKYNVGVCICGIENSVQEKTISNLNFAYKQGYYYGKPVRYE